MSGIKRLLELAGVDATNSYVVKHNNEATVDDVVSDVLALSVIGHIWHWQTKSYAQHKAFDDFYNNMNDHADKLAELYMAVVGHVVSPKIHVDGGDFSMTNVHHVLDACKTKIVAVETILLNDEHGKYHGVGDVLTDVIKEIDQLVYLLTLS